MNYFRLFLEYAVGPVPSGSGAGKAPLPGREANELGLLTDRRLHEVDAPTIQNALIVGLVTGGLDHV